MRTVKIVAPIFVVLLTLSLTSIATASGQEFRATEYPVLVEGTQLKNFKFTIGGSSAECETASIMSAEPNFITAPTEALLLTATYTKCTAFGFIEGEVKMGGCLYRLMTNSTLDITGHATEPTSCEKTPITISIKAIGCEVHINPQTGLAGITYTNNSGKIKATYNISKPTYTSNEKGTGCPKNGETTKYTTEQELTGHNEKSENDAIEMT